MYIYLKAKSSQNLKRISFFKGPLIFQHLTSDNGDIRGSKCKKTLADLAKRITSGG